MTEANGNQRERDIARDVLSHHEIAVDSGDLDLIADGLGMAGDPLDLWTAVAIGDQEKYQTQIQTVERLEMLLAQYRPVVAYEDEVRKRGKPYVLNDTDYHLMADFGLDIAELVRQLETLLTVERHVLQTLPKGGLPGGAPPKAKNVGASCIYEILRENGVKPWAACSLIAEMFVEAGIDDRVHRKIHRSLFDKLQRLEVR